MDRIDRRTFLTTGLKAGAALAVAGGAADALDSAGSASATVPPDRGAPGGPSRLTTTGVADPVGVDPDGVQFAWQVSDTRRGAVQGAYRVVVSGPGRSPSTVWDSGTTT